MDCSICLPQIMRIGWHMNTKWALFIDTRGLGEPGWETHFDAFWDKKNTFPSIRFTWMYYAKIIWPCSGMFLICDWGTVGWYRIIVALCISMYSKLILYVLVAPSCGRECSMQGGLLVSSSGCHAAVSEGADQGSVWRRLMFQRIAAHPVRFLQGSSGCMYSAARNGVLL